MISFSNFINLDDFLIKGIQTILESIYRTVKTEVQYLGFDFRNFVPDPHTPSLSLIH